MLKRFFPSRVSREAVLRGLSRFSSVLSPLGPGARWAVLALLLFGVISCEVRTSVLQALWFSHYNTHLRYGLAPGPSASARFPRHGPFDERRGYSRIPEFAARLGEEGFRISEQARISPDLELLISLRIPPPYRDRPVAGLTIRNADGSSLYSFSSGERLLYRFEEIPPLLVRTLLFIEDRQLEERSGSRANPAIEWGRLLKAALFYIGNRLGLPFPIQGGSTLAVQLEKFRHSPNGKTDSPIEKLRQIAAATLKAYRDGADVRAKEREIVLDYLNSMPLAGAPGRGEVFGLGEGLHVWFGLDLEETLRALNSPGSGAAKARAFKHALALLVSLKAPTTYLVKERAALAQRTDAYIRLLAKSEVIDSKLAEAALREPIRFLASPPPPQPPSSAERASSSVRATLMTLLGLPDLYSLDRLDLEVDTTIDAHLQEKVSRLLRALNDPEFVRANGLDGAWLLEDSDPRKVTYSLLLVERTAEGNLVRVHADNLSQPLDFNRNVKLELGSTAKLRTLIHYLEIVEELHRELAPLGVAALEQRARTARDPLTRWAAKTLKENPGLRIEALLDLALGRRYSASPEETFFTGGGAHTFHNFDPSDDHRTLTVREGFRNSVNLVFIRLMRDLERYHRARLPYDHAQILSDVRHPVRLRMLQEIAEKEAKTFLLRAYQKYRGLSAEEIVDRILEGQTASEQRLTLLFFSWHRTATEEKLAAWLADHLGQIRADRVRRLYRAYGNPRLNLADYAYLLSRDPLELWAAGELAREPELTWEELYGRSGEARRLRSLWLFQSRNRHAQDLRLRARIEEDAFARMSPYWRRLGYPFDRLVPSYATAIGNSADRPVALAELMGIIINDGVRLPIVSLRRLRFARGTPYETAFEPSQRAGEQLISPAVARAVRGLLAEVVEKGTARRVKGQFRMPDGAPVIVGGKTGSGDNRYTSLINRTAAFVFYIGERYFGVITAYVPGRDALRYEFTSALPVTILKLLAPAINERLKENQSLS